MKNIINVSFLFIFFYSFSQDYKLVHIYEQLDDKSYKIKNVNNTTIGFLKFKGYEFRYFNINNELVAKEIISMDYDYEDAMFPLDIKTSTEVLDLSDELIYVRFWDEEEERFKIFVDGEEIGYLKNNKLKNQWEFFNNTFLKIDNYVNIFKIKSKPIPKIVIKKPPLNTTKNTNKYKVYPSPNINSNAKNSSFLLSDVSGRFYVGIDQINLPADHNNNGYGITPEYKYEIGFFTYSTNLYFGIQFATQKSNTKTEYDDLNDQIWALGFGFGLFRDKVFVKSGLGYHTYNYPTIESFGHFYDIGEEFYGDIGLKISMINLGGFYILPEVSIDTNGLMSFGLGFAF